MFPSSELNSNGWLPGHEPGVEVARVVRLVDAACLITCGSCNDRPCHYRVGSSYDANQVKVATLTEPRLCPFPKNVWPRWDTPENHRFLGASFRLWLAGRTCVGLPHRRAHAWLSCAHRSHPPGAVSADVFGRSVSPHRRRHRAFLSLRPGWSIRGSATASSSAATCLGGTIVVPFALMLNCSRRACRWGSCRRTTQRHLLLPQTVSV